MTRKLQKILVVLGIGGITLFQAGSCDYLADQFATGFMIGLNGGDLGDVFGSSIGGYGGGSYGSYGGGSDYDVSSYVDDVWNYDPSTGTDYWDW